ncbi:MAG: hypothetical protein LBP95_00705 [Deltaproteobacteria bacterium]|jgi:hypothetical protein|nr:hypothetical protein [Deltaproteobacteria bacterium]
MVFAGGFCLSRVGSGRVFLSRAGSGGAFLPLVGPGELFFRWSARGKVSSFAGVSKFFLLRVVGSPGAACFGAGLFGLEFCGGFFRFPCSQDFMFSGFKAFFSFLPFLFFDLSFRLS